MRVDKFTVPQRPQEVYSDFLVNMNAHPNTGFLLKRTDVDAVKRALRNLLQTDKGERMFQPDFGSDVRRYLFEPATEITKSGIKDAILSAIETYERRVNVLDVIIGLSSDEHTYIIDIYFTVLNNPEPVSVNIQLDRVR